MLKEIINSKTDSAILSFFLTAPERSFSVNELSKRLGITHLKTAHGLNKITSAGALRSFSKKGKKYYLINPKYKLLPEMKTFWVKAGPSYHDELFSAIKALGEIKAAFLSGIFCGYPNLPVDILLVGKVNLTKLDEFLKSAEKMIGQEINYSVMSVSEFMLRRDTFDRFIKDIFDYRHITILDELAKRRK